MLIALHGSSELVQFLLHNHEQTIVAILHCQTLGKTARHEHRSHWHLTARNCSKRKVVLGCSGDIRPVAVASTADTSCTWCGACHATAFLLSGTASEAQEETAASGPTWMQGLKAAPDTADEAWLSRKLESLLLTALQNTCSNKLKHFVSVSDKTNGKPNARIRCIYMTESQWLLISPAQTPVSN
jgi:hypothetical protein